MNLMHRFTLRARIADARATWLEVEQLAATEYDDQLEEDVDMARRMIAAAGDRVDCLILTGGEPEPEEALA